MIFKRAATGRGFTLVELLLVIVLISILMALVTLSGFNMMESTNAQAEVRRIIRTVHALRSAWLSHYADTQKMIGVPGGLPWSSDSIERTLSQYSDRSLADEVKRYGEIQVRPPDSPPGNRSIYIGFASTQQNKGSIWSKSSTASMIMKSLREQENDYELDVDAENNHVFIRIR